MIPAPVTRSKRHVSRNCQRAMVGKVCMRALQWGTVFVERAITIPFLKNAGSLYTTSIAAIFLRIFRGKHGKQFYSPASGGMCPTLLALVCGGEQPPTEERAYQCNTGEVDT